MSIIHYGTYLYQLTINDKLHNERRQGQGGCAHNDGVIDIMKQGVENSVLFINEIGRLVHEHVVNECGYRAKGQEVGRVLIWR